MGYIILMGMFTAEKPLARLQRHSVRLVSRQFCETLPSVRSPRKTLMEVIPSFGVGDRSQTAWSSGKEAVTLASPYLTLKIDISTRSQSFKRQNITTRKPAKTRPRSQIYIYKLVRAARSKKNKALLDDGLVVQHKTPCSLPVAGCFGPNPPHKRSMP
ncbi:hypothetical protein BS47DRAFT_407421 [Hydnum rufescens UP504]|uniref:Uncharacterized protein n=1 Tax=Hydnum rufescens UP504 TaxID=1448309 RepID=A0A9P6BAN6_9AGAM|nr:hypothetical protein BS47DRAFT_407421 [Hydnum rufescens UP504]